VRSVDAEAQLDADPPTIKLTGFPRPGKTSIFKDTSSGQMRWESSTLADFISRTETPAHIRKS